MSPVPAAAVIALGEGMVTINRPADGPPPAWAHCWMGTAGAEMNVAIGLARLGHAVRWATALGDDPLGDWVCNAARGEGVAVEAQRHAERTGMIVKIARADDEPDVRYYRDGSAFACHPPEVDPRGARALFLTGITPAVSPACRAAATAVVERAQAAGVPLWFDLNLRRRLWSEAEAAPVLRWFAARSAVLFAGDDEAAVVTGLPVGDPARQAAALRALGARAVVLRTAAGALLYDDAGLCEEPRESGVVVRDAIGAGDAFAAGFLSAHLDGLDGRACLRRAHHCGAAVCRTIGDWEGFPTRRQLAARSGVALR